MKKVIIIDDERDARRLIREYLLPHSDFEIIGEAADGFEAVKQINFLEPDLVFLDIQMPGLSGFQVVQQLVHIPVIIFTTAFDNYALKAFDSNATDYLLKPYTAERFNQSLAKAIWKVPHVSQQQHIEQFDEYPHRILVENGNKLVNLDVNDILYLEAERDYTWIHTSIKSYLSNYGIGSLARKMDPRHFLRIHRSCIVNLKSVQEVHKDGYNLQVMMTNGKSLSVSRSYLEEIRKLFY
ncbi:MAG: response regulator transcription factor [Chitinophagaceae bacterium]|nr:MAG: response regulator transcription factor [Chitinophagaceae bacterium]